MRNPGAPAPTLGPAQDLAVPVRDLWAGRRKGVSCLDLHTPGQRGGGGVPLTARPLGFLDFSPQGRPVPCPQKGIQSCLCPPWPPMPTLKVTFPPGGHMSGLSETLETRPSGGSLQPLLLLFICACFPFLALFKSCIPVHEEGGLGKWKQV